MKCVTQKKHGGCAKHPHDLRLLKLLADKFQIETPSIIDIHSYNKDEIVQYTTDTIEYDIQRLRSSHIAIFNKCCDPTINRNGILTALHPMEGYWLFKGPSKSNTGISCFGGTFGSQNVCGAFPTATFRIPSIQREGVNAKSIQNMSKRQQQKNIRKNVSTVFTTNTGIIVQTNEQTPRQMQEYMCFDENFMKNLEKMQWNRDNGVIELMPIVVGSSTQFS
jgi:hypothetical protein